MAANETPTIVPMTAVSTMPMVRLLMRITRSRHSRARECNPIQSWRPDSFGCHNGSQYLSSGAVCGRACDQQTRATPPKVPFSECANGAGQLDYSLLRGNDQGALPSRTEVTRRARRAG